MANNLTNDSENQRRILQDEAFASQRDPMLNLSQLEMCALQILSLPKTQPLTDNEQKILLKCLETAKGDSAFNQRLKQTMTQNDGERGFNEQAVRSLMQYTDKTKHTAIFASAFAKLNQEPPLLTLKEYSVLLEMAKLNEFFKNVQSKVVLKGEMATLAEQVANVPLVLSQLDESLKQKTAGRPKAFLFDGPQPERGIGPYPHFFAQCVSKTTGSPAHAETEQTRNLYAQNYIMNFDNLLSENSKTLLKGVLGENYLEEISQHFTALLRENHDMLFRKCAGMQSPLQMSEISAEAPYLLVSEFLGPTVFNACVQLEGKLQEVLQSKKLSKGESLIQMPFSEKEAREKTPSELLTQMKALHQIQEIKAAQKRYTS
jgi:hypothetical protein